MSCTAAFRSLSLLQQQGGNLFGISKQSLTRVRASVRFVRVQAACGVYYGHMIKFDGLSVSGAVSFIVTTSELVAEG